MEVLKTNQEIVHEGWLIKSPPTKLWRARWRRRWFTLRHSGELPGQYTLEYSEDKNKRLKGKIDLDQCEQVDVGFSLENKKQKYQFMFNVKTPKRTYYLVAENEADMNKWVDAVCQVCGLKAQDDEQQVFTFETQESPPISPASTISGPYIPISECFSGRSLNDMSSLSSALGQTQEHYDAPRRLAPSPPRSPTTTDADSVFTDDEWTNPVPSGNWGGSLPSSSSDKPSINSANNESDLYSWKVRRRFGKHRNDAESSTGQADDAPAPPRPPKPAHMMLEASGHNYLNLDGVTESSKPVTPSTPAPLATQAVAAITDETYDFPRSHQPGMVDATGSLARKSRHCYTNAAPVSAGAVGKDERVFRYDFHDDEPPSPRSESSATATYSNLPSPLVRSDTSTVTSVSGSQPHLASTTASVAPPVIYRELKPGRSESSGGIESGEPSPVEPPSINRKLKPPLNRQNYEMTVPLQLASPPGRGRVRTVPSPTPRVTRTSRYQSTSDEDNNAFDDKEEVYYYQDKKNFIPAFPRKFVDLQYLDLDLGTSENTNSTSAPPARMQHSTAYKTVDFVKTEAFNRTRQIVEEKRKQCTGGLS